MSFSTLPLSPAPTSSLDIPSFDRDGDCITADIAATYFSSSSLPFTASFPSIASSSSPTIHPSEPHLPPLSPQTPHAASWYEYLYLRTIYSPRLNARFQLLQQVGIGGHAVVHLAVPYTSMHIPQVHYVVKYVFSKKQAIEEARLHATVACGKKGEGVTCIVALWDVIMDDEEGGGVFLVMEYMDRGDAYRWTMKHHHPERYYGKKAMLLDAKEVDEKRQQAQRVGLQLFLDVLGAVQHCHRLGIYHRDLKLDNILLTKDAVTQGDMAKLADFGIATTKHVSSQVHYGTESTMAPEVLLGQPNDEYVVSFADIWSLGIVLFNLATGLAPWVKADVEEATAFAYYVEHAQQGKQKAIFAIKYLVHGEKRVDSGSFELMSDALADIVVGMLDLNPKKRMSLDVVREKVEAMLKQL